MFKLGDGAYRAWEEEQQRPLKQQGGGSPGSTDGGSGGRRNNLRSPSPTKRRGKRKSPEKAPASRSRLGAECWAEAAAVPASIIAGSGPAAAEAAAGAEGWKERPRRRRSADSDALGPKQLLFAGKAASSGAALAPLAPPSPEGVQPCSEWEEFKLFMASPRRPSVNGAAVAPPPATLPSSAAAVAGQQAQPMDLDASSSCLQIATLPVCSAVASHESAPPPLPPQPLSPRLPSLPFSTPVRLPPGALQPLPDNKENGSSGGSGGGGWVTFAAAPCHDSPAGPDPASLAGGGPCAAVDRALLMLQSPATERAAAVRDILAADIMLLMR